MKREDPTTAQTMTKSKALLQGYDEEPAEEIPQREATKVEGGDTDEKIDQFTLGLEDILASPPQDQP